MAHRRQPGLPPIRGRDAIDLDAIRVHGHSQHGHVVLPANDRPQASKRRVKDGERGCVAETPDQTLGRGRHDLAMFAQIAVWRDEYGRAVDSASLPLDDANHHVDPELGSEDDELVQCWSRNVDGALPVPAEVITAFRSTVADDGAERDASGIAGDESLRKQNQARSTSCCVGGQLLHLGKRGGAIEDDRCSLHYRDSVALGGGHDSLPVAAGWPLLDWSSLTSRRVTGVAIPAFAARLSKAPPNASSSRGRPAAWSRCIEDSIDSGTESSRWTTASRSISTPSAPATATTSPISAMASSRRLVRIAPTLARSCVVSSAIGASNANLSNNMANSSSRIRTSRPEALR